MAWLFGLIIAALWLTIAQAQTFLEPTALQLRSFYCAQVLKSEMQEGVPALGSPDNVSQYAQGEWKKYAAQQLLRISRFLITQNMFDIDPIPMLDTAIAAKQDLQNCTAIASRITSQMAATCAASRDFAECIHAYVQSHPNDGCSGIRMCNGDLSWLPY